MSYNLRENKDGKGRKHKGAPLKEFRSNMPISTEATTSNIVEINDKLDLLLSGKDDTDRKLSQILDKITQTEKDILNLKTRQNDLEASVDFLSNEFELLKKQQGSLHAVAGSYAKLQKKTDDLENRSKRNNLVLWNIPENAEEGKSCEEFVEYFFLEHMKIPNLVSVEVERAHRTPTFRKQNLSSDKPRPIHVRLLRYQDRQKVLKNAKLLKDNPWNGNKVFISDDVSVKIRQEREYLRKNKLEAIKAKPNVSFAYIPFLIPTRIIYKTSDGMYKNFFFESLNTAE